MGIAIGLAAFLVFGRGGFVVGLIVTMISRTG
jgi:hypothetical protein